MKNKEFIIGKVILIKKLPTEKIVTPHTKSGYSYSYKALYKCFCKNEFVATISDINRKDSRKTRSCGCYALSRKVSNYPHGDKGTRLYGIFLTMRNRCYDSNVSQYKDYGGRGITVCDEWKYNYITFKDWAISNGYTDKLTIDRIDSILGYSPENCRWVTPKIQNINKRETKTNKTGFRGVRKVLNKFYGVLSINGKKKLHGPFKTPEEASEAYQKAKKERDEIYYKEFEEQQLKNKK